MALTGLEENCFLHLPCRIEILWVSRCERRSWMKRVLEWKLGLRIETSLYINFTFWQHCQLTFKILILRSVIERNVKRCHSQLRHTFQIISTSSGYGDIASGWPLAWHFFYFMSRYILSCTLHHGNDVAGCAFRNDFVAWYSTSVLK